MIRLFDIIIGPICCYFILTVIEPFRVLFPATPKVNPSKHQRRKMPGAGDPSPSVFRAILKQRSMMSPERHYVKLPAQISVTEQYLRTPNLVDLSERHHYATLH